MRVKWGLTQDIVDVNFLLKLRSNKFKWVRIGRGGKKRNYKVPFTQINSDFFEP